MVIDRRDMCSGYRHPFLVGSYYFGGVGDTPRTLTDLAMSECSYSIRRKYGWWAGFRNADARANWEQEIQSRSWTVPIALNQVEISLTDRQVTYILDELEGYDLLRDVDNGCQVSCFERIWESHALLDTSTLADLNRLLSHFRHDCSSKHTRDEDGVTTHLIDPLLYSLINRVSPIFDSSKEGSQCQTVPFDTHSGTASYAVSRQFAYLPTDFFVSSTGDVQALSYINNLHPQLTSLYRRFEDVVSACVPLFEHVLTDLHRNNPLVQRIKGPCKYTEWDEPEPPEYSDDEDGWALYERQIRHWVMQRPIKLPYVPSSGYQGGLEYRKHYVNLRNKKLQIVIRVSETRLHPGCPSYPGSPWHVEGMKNERIVACALYYSSVENIVDNALEFRMAVTSPRGFTPGDRGATVRTWGFRDGDPCHQRIGSVSMQTGFCIAFPNIYQHRHTPFTLLDPTKEGHQRVVALYLVDPDIQPIISTSSVPPQQDDWMRSAMHSWVDPRIPVELVDRIVDKVDGVRSLSEAERFREEMLKERTEFLRTSDLHHFCIPFDIWNVLS